MEKLSRLSSRPGYPRAPPRISSFLPSFSFIYIFDRAFTAVSTTVSTISQKRERERKFGLWRSCGIPVESRDTVKSRTEQPVNSVSGKLLGTEGRGLRVRGCVKGRRWTGSQFRTSIRSPAPSLMHRINSTSYFYGRGAIYGGRARRRMVAAVATLSRSK